MYRKVMLKLNFKYIQRADLKKLFFCCAVLTPQHYHWYPATYRLTEESS